MPVSSSSMLQAGPQNLHVPPELVDDKALDQRLLLRLQQRHRAVEGGEHAAPVDVARQQHRRARPCLAMPMLTMSSCLQVDLRRAARPLDDDDVVLRRQGARRPP